MPDSQNGGGGGEIDVGAMRVFTILVEDMVLSPGMSPSGGSPKLEDGFGLSGISCERRKTGSKPKIGGRRRSLRGPRAFRT
jgi:hypothetical protein